MRSLKTENCIICGNKAVRWMGHVLGRQKMASGNYAEAKIIAGFCEKCAIPQSDENGCFGKYEPKIAGKCIPLFEK